MRMQCMQAQSSWHSLITCCIFLSCEHLEPEFLFTPALLPTHCRPSLLLQGRPKGEDKAEDKKKFSLAPVATRLQERLGKKVRERRISLFRGRV